MPELKQVSPKQQPPAENPPPAPPVPKEQMEYLNIEEASPSRFNIWMYVFIAGAVFTLGILGFFAYKFRQNIASRTASPTPQANASSAPSPTPVPEIKKEDLKVQVLNGSGIAGQAAKVKEALAGLGLSQIEIGNAEGALAKETVVVFSKQASDSLRKAVITKLEGIFEAVSTSDNGDLGTDILITTGKPKSD